MLGRFYPPGTRGRYWTWRGTIRGREHELSLKTTDRKRARERAAELVGRLGRDADPSRPVSFAEAAEAYAAFRPPARHNQKNLDRLAAHWRDVAVAELRHADLVDAAQRLLPGRSPSTWNRAILTPAAAVLHYAARQEWCAYRKFERFAEPRLSPRRPASDAAVRTLIANADLTGTYKPQRNAYLKKTRTDRVAKHKRLLLAVLYELGIRISDALRLRDSQFDLPAGILEVTADKTEERGKVRLSAELVAMLADTPRCDGGKLFPWSSRHGVYKWLRPLTRRLGVTYTPHMSRHAMASDLHAEGVERARIRERGLWRDERSVARYVQRSDLAAPVRGAGRVVNES